MTSVPTTRLRLDLQETGDNPNTWGLRVNNNASLIEEAVAGVAKVPVNGNVVLSSQNYLSDEARKAVLQLSGTGLAGNAPALITIPAVEKVYQIDNRCSGPVTVGFSAQTAVTCREGLLTTIYSDGSSLTTDDVALNRVAKPTGSVDANGQVFANAADGVNPTDLATVRQTGGSQAAASAAAAAASATSAANSATQAANSATSAANSATAAQTFVPANYYAKATDTGLIVGLSYGPDALV